MTRHGRPDRLGRGGAATALVLALLMASGCTTSGGQGAASSASSTPGASDSAATRGSSPSAVSTSAASTSSTSASSPGSSTTSSAPRPTTDPQQAAAAKPYLDKADAAGEVEQVMPGYRVVQSERCVVVGDLLEGQLRRHLRECDTAVQRIRRGWPKPLPQEKVLVLAPESDQAFATLLRVTAEDSEGQISGWTGQFVVARHLGGFTTEDQVYELTQVIFLFLAMPNPWSGGVAWVSAGAALWLAEESMPDGALPVDEMLLDVMPPADRLDALPADEDVDTEVFGWPYSYAAAVFVVESFGKDALVRLLERQNVTGITDDEAVRPVLGISYAELDRRFSAWIKRQLAGLEPAPGDEGTA